MGVGGTTLDWWGIPMDPREPFDGLEMSEQDGALLRNHDGERFEVGDVVLIETETGFSAGELLTLDTIVRWYYGPELKRMDLCESDECDRIPPTTIVTKISRPCNFRYHNGALLPIEKERREKRARNALKQFLGEDSDSDDDTNVVKALQLRSAPKTLLRREKQREDIEAFVRSAFSGSAGRSMYIAGMPGTGKTATVHEVVRRCRDLDFDFVDINAMRLPRPSHAYTLLYKAIFPDAKSIAGDSAAKKLETLFSSQNDDDEERRKKPRTEKRKILALVDELDFIVTKQQTVLYNLFEWPTRRCDVILCVIGIANTMDLPERMDPKVRSRLGAQKRLIFPPYTLDDVEAILHDRLSSFKGAFAKGAVRLAAMKVASYSGDIRRALQICARAAELATKEVQTSDVNAAVRELTQSSGLQAVKDASSFDLVILTALCAELRNSSSDLLHFNHLATRLSRIAALHSSAILHDDPAVHLALHASLTNYSDLLNALHNLHDANILTLEKSGPGFDPRLPNLRLELDHIDISKTLTDVLRLPLAINLLKSS